MLTYVEIPGLKLGGPIPWVWVLDYSGEVSCEQPIMDIGILSLLLTCYDLAAVFLSLGSPEMMDWNMNHDQMNPFSFKVLFSGSFITGTGSKTKTMYAPELPSLWH